MGYSSGLGSSLGWAVETVYGTYVAPTKWAEFNSEKLSLQKKIISNEGLRGGARMGRVGRRVVTTREATGSIDLDVSSRGFGVMLTHALGTPTPAATEIATSGVYRQVHTIGEPSRSLTVQVAKPQSDAVVKPYTYVGCKIPSFELSCAVDQYLSMKLDVDARDETTGQTLVAPSYVTADEEMYHFGQLEIQIGGTVSTTDGIASVADAADIVGCKGFSVKHALPLATDRYFAGASSLKAAPLENGMRDITGNVSAEFASQAQLYDVMAADETTALRIRFDGSVAVGDLSRAAAFEILLSAVKFDSGSPNVDGPDVLDNDVAFKAYDDGVNAPIQILYESVDATVL
jgi:hypothetical protein